MQGFAELGRRLGAASAAGGKDGFLAMGRAYLAFAREEPAYYAAMFNTGHPGTTPSGDDPGFAALERAVGQYLGITDRAKVRSAALLVFALTHGLTSLTTPDSIAVPGGLTEPEALLDRGVRGAPAGTFDVSRAAATAIRRRRRPASPGRIADPNFVWAKSSCLPLPRREVNAIDMTFGMII